MDGNDNFEIEEDAQDQGENDHEFFVEVCIRLFKNLKQYAIETGLPLLESLTQSELTDFMSDA